MPNVILEVPDEYRGIVRLGLENSAATLRQAVQREIDAESRLPSYPEVDRWMDILAWLNQAADKLR